MFCTRFIFLKIRITNFKFQDGWIFVVNAEKNNKYRNSPNNEIAYEIELSRVPQDVLGFFNSTKEIVVSRVVSTVLPIVHITHNTKHITNNTEKGREIKNTISDEDVKLIDGIFK
jgi:hypothetical protein